MTDHLLDHLRPQTLARLIGELIADHTEELWDGEFDFHTEAARNAYTTLLAAGIRNCGQDEFFLMVESAVDEELGRKERQL